MNKMIKFDGIDCANCATKLERKLNKIKGIEANISFIAGKIFLEYEDYDAFDKAIQTCIKEEPDIRLIYIDDRKDK